MFAGKSINELLAAFKGDDIRSRVARISFWALLGSVISKGFLLVSSVIIARIIGKVHFGEYSIIQSTLSFFAVFAGFSLGTASTKYVAEFRDTDKSKTGSIIASSSLVALIFGLVFSIVLLLASSFVSVSLIGSGNLSGQLKLASAILLLNAINGAVTGALAGFEDFKSIAKISILTGVVTLVGQTLLVLTLGLPGAFVGLIAAFLAQYLSGLFFLVRKCRKYGISLSLSRPLGNLSYLWRFSLPSVLGAIIVSMTLWVSNLFLVRNGNGLNEMAVYNAAAQWQNIILFIPVAISQISLPLFSNMKNDLFRFTKLIRYNILLNFSICLILAVLFSLFSGIIMRSYGSDFSNGSVVLIILAAAAILNSVNMVIGQIIAGLGKMWAGLFINLIWAAFFLSLSHYFISSGKGAKGLAEAMLIAYIAHTVIVSFTSLYFVKKNSETLKVNGN